MEKQEIVFLTVVVLMVFIGLAFGWPRSRSRMQAKASYRNTPKASNVNRPWYSLGRRRLYVESLSCSLSRNGLKRWRRLVNMTMGDQNAAKRLVQLERSNAPGADVEELLERAIEKWQRDLR